MNDVIGLLKGLGINPSTDRISSSSKQSTLNTSPPNSDSSSSSNIDSIVQALFDLMHQLFQALNQNGSSDALSNGGGFNNSTSLKGNAIGYSNLKFK